MDTGHLIQELTLFEERLKHRCVKVTIISTAKYLYSVFELYLNTTGMFAGGKGGRSVGLTKLPLSCADCLEI